MDIQSLIRDIVAEKLSDSSKSSTKLSQEAIVQEIRKKGVVDSIMDGIKFENKIFKSNQPKIDPTKTNNPLKASMNLKPNEIANQEYLLPLNKVNVDPSKRHLYLQILNGKAFLEYLNQDDAMSDDVLLPGYSQSHGNHFNIFIHFRGQRFKTRSFACTCEPKINEGFLLELHKDRPNASETTSLMADSAVMLSICDPIHIVMVRTDINQETHLVSSHFLEWRTCLTMPNNKQNISIELMGTGAESKIPAGLLNICLQLVPTLDDPIREDIFGAQLGLEHSKNTERERLFLVYAKQWWKEYLEIRDDHKNRLVKIFAQVSFTLILYFLSNDF
jgi:centrosomal protein CEP76